MSKLCDTLIRACDNTRTNSRVYGKMYRTFPKKTNPTNSNSSLAKKTQRSQDRCVNDNAKKIPKRTSPRNSSSPSASGIVHFVYSEAVMSAVRSELNAHPAFENVNYRKATPRKTRVEIMKLPDICKHVASFGLDLFDAERSQKAESVSGKTSMDVSEQRNMKHIRLTEKV